MASRIEFFGGIRLFRDDSPIRPPADNALRVLAGLANRGDATDKPLREDVAAMIWGDGPQGLTSLNTELSKLRKRLGQQAFGGDRSDFVWLNTEWVRTDIREFEAPYHVIREPKCPSLVDRLLESV